MGNNEKEKTIRIVDSLFDFSNSKSSNYLKPTLQSENLFDEKVKAQINDVIEFINSENIETFEDIYTNPKFKSLPLEEDDVKKYYDRFKKKYPDLEGFDPSFDPTKAAIVAAILIGTLLTNQIVGCSNPSLDPINKIPEMDRYFDEFSEIYYQRINTNFNK